LRLTIGKKIILGYGLAMLFVAIAGVMAYRGVERLIDANEWVSHTFLVIDRAEEIRIHLLEIESACRGFIMTGDERFMEPNDESRRALAVSRNSLRMLTADNLFQQRRLDNLDPIIENRLAGFAVIPNLRREKGLAAALAAVPQVRSLERMVEIRNLLTAIEGEERSLLDERQSRAQLSAQSANRLIFYGSLLLVALSALIGIATHRSIARPLSEFQQFVTAVGNGDLTQESAREGKDELGNLAHGLNQMVTRLKNMAGHTRAVTESLNVAAIDILASSRQQAASIGQQVAAYQETNATMQQVSKSCFQISERAKEVTITAEAVSLSNITVLDAAQKTNQTVEAIHEQAEAVAQNIVSLSEKTQMVGDILATVNDIAEQSHLLALNAAIEAAAAGEHGRTFSVVAGEIKNLADQSKAATVQVKTILGDIQKEINTSVMLTEEAVKRVDLGKHQADVTATAIRNMAANIDQSVQAFQQIVAGTNQQQVGFENVMQAMKDLSRGSEEAATSTRLMEKSAVNLADLGKQLGTATEGYRL
jgi:methyl-accepting chemotaxis protein